MRTITEWHEDRYDPSVNQIESNFIYIAHLTNNWHHTLSSKLRGTGTRNPSRWNLGKKFGRNQTPFWSLQHIQGLFFYASVLHLVSRESPLLEVPEIINQNQDGVATSWESATRSRQELTGWVYRLKPTLKLKTSFMHLFMLTCFMKELCNRYETTKSMPNYNSHRRGHFIWTAGICSPSVKKKKKSDDSSFNVAVFWAQKKLKEQPRKKKKKKKKTLYDVFSSVSWH